MTPSPMREPHIDVDGANQNDEYIEIKPQEGPQTVFMATPADIGIYGGSAGGGKMLPITTQIPTPDGWTTMGDIVPGDMVLSEFGKPCKVTHAHPIQIPTKSYRLTFDDGHSISACSEHLWYTLDVYQLSAETRSGISCGSIKTTQVLFDTQRIGKEQRSNHAIPVTLALDLPDAELPIDPYLLGAWLGDGTTDYGSITTADSEIICEFEKLGYKCTQWRNRTRANQPDDYDGFGYTWGVSGFTSELRSVGVLGNKYIPSIYLRASYAQRLALLQGLCDTDGTVPNGGNPEFNNSNLALMQSVAELIRSLGSKAKVNGRPGKYSIKWCAEYQCFRLPRKRIRQKVSEHRRTTRYRYITSIVEDTIIEPMRCITVDNPTGLYLCGDGMIPTHNTWALLLEFLRNVGVFGFGGVIFRRTFQMVTNEGGLWDESVGLMPHAGGKDTPSALKWEWPDNKVRLSFKHMQHEADRLGWQGAQIPYIGFDELTHFTEKQFFYLLSRNRTNCGVIPYMRATCNPDPNSWVKRFLAPWLDKDFVQPNGERRNLQSGELGYFSRVDGVWRWHDAIEYRMEQLLKLPQDRNIKTVVFVRASVFDNKILLKNNPEYLASLRAQSLVEQEQLLHGNWDIVEGGNMFRDEWFIEIQQWELPLRFYKLVRFWDLASSKPSEVEKNKDDPDYTAGALLGMDYSGQYWFLDLKLLRGTPAEVEKLVAKTAEEDYELYGRMVQIGIEEEPGSSGVFTTHHFKSVVLPGYSVEGYKTTGSKIGRAKPVSGYAQKHGLRMVRASWNPTFIAMATAFPNVDVHDDVVDAISGAYNVMNAPDDTPLYQPRMSHVSGWGRQNAIEAATPYETAVVTTHRRASEASIARKYGRLRIPN